MPGFMSTRRTTRPLIDRAQGHGRARRHVVYLIIGDNGASARRATLQGAFNEMANFNGMADIETP